MIDIGSNVYSFQTEGEKNAEVNSAASDGYIMMTALNASAAYFLK